MGLVQEAVHFLNLVGCSSRLIVRVALDANSMAAGMCWSLIQMYQSYKCAHSLASLSRARRVSERMYHDMEPTVAAKPHSDGGHPWSIPLLAWMCA